MQEHFIDELRGRIDNFDREIVNLLCCRMDMCGFIGEYKKSCGIKSIRDPIREEALMTNLEAYSSYEGLVRKIWPVIIEYSRELQEGKHTIKGVDGFEG